MLQREGIQRVCYQLTARDERSVDSTIASVGRVDLPDLHLDTVPCQIQAQHGYHVSQNAGLDASAERSAMLLAVTGVCHASARRHHRRARWDAERVVVTRSPGCYHVAACRGLARWLGHARPHTPWPVAELYCLPFGVCQ